MSAYRTEPRDQGERVRWPVFAIAVLALLVVILAITTVVGFTRPAGGSTDAAELARLRTQTAQQAQQLTAAKACITGYEAQRKQQADAVQEASDAVGDVKDALGRVAKLDLGGAASLVARSGQQIADASAKLATVNRSKPSACSDVH